MGAKASESDCCFVSLLVVCHSPRHTHTQPGCIYGIDSEIDYSFPCNLFLESISGIIFFEIDYEIIFIVVAFTYPRYCGFGSCLSALPVFGHTGSRIIDPSIVVPRHG